MKAPRWIAHVDMDCFFVAVERLFDKKLMGVPVVVGGEGARSVVTAASYEARKFGVHSAMPMMQARRLCKSLIVVPPRFERYREASRAVFEVLREFSPVVEPVSVDEAYLDLTGCEGLFGDWESTAKSMKSKVFERSGLVCSVGMSTNRMVSKIASDLRKPDALVIVESGSESHFMADLPLAKIPGVGKKTTRLLEGAGFRICRDLARLDATEARMRLSPLVGSASRELWQRSRGEDNRPVGQREMAKSIGVEHTFSRDITSTSEVRRILVDICEEVASEVRRKGREGQTVTLKVRLPPFRTYTRARRLKVGTQYAEQFREVVWELMQEFLDEPVRLLGVSLKLVDPDEKKESVAPPVQLDLFSEVTHSVNLDFVKLELGVDSATVRDSGRFTVQALKKRQAVERLKDELRERFGKSSVVRQRDLK